MTFEEACEIAAGEYRLFQNLFYEQIELNPGLSFDEINELVIYSHPVFADSADQAMYDEAAAYVAIAATLSRI
jgi:hypothetical protein